MGVIYRPPGTEMLIFNENMSSLLNALENENKYCYLMGDYNINLLNYGKHKETSEFVDLIHSYPFISLINKPTRLASQNATLIDNIFANFYNHIENTFQCLFFSDVSDHCPIIHVDYSSKGAKTESYYTRRNMSQRNRLAFQNAISAIDWQMVYSETDMQNAFSLFHSKLVELYHKHFPKQKITYKHDNRKPWLSQALQEGIKNKNRLYLKYNRIKSVANEIKYKTYRKSSIVFWNLLKENTILTWLMKISTTSRRPGRSLKILLTKMLWENVSLNLNWVMDQLHVTNQLLVRNLINQPLA